MSLVELDYGGLVHLLDDGALCADQSVAEVSASISAVAAGEIEFATAMYQRFSGAGGRWRRLNRPPERHEMTFPNLRRRNYTYR